MALKLPTNAGPQFHIAKQTYVYVHASINIYDLNSAQRREAPGNPPQIVTCIALLTPFYQGSSFPLRNKETGVIDTVSRVSRSVQNIDTILFSDSVISFRCFVIPLFRHFVPPFCDSVVYRLPFDKEGNEQTSCSHASSSQHVVCCSFNWAKAPSLFWFVPLVVPW